MKPLNIIDDRTPEQIAANGDDYWPDGTPYTPHQTLRTYAEINANIYQHGPLDWDELANRAGWEHVYGPANPVTMTADQALILLECRDELIRRDTQKETHST